MISRGSGSLTPKTALISTWTSVTIAVTFKDSRPKRFSSKLSDSNRSATRFQMAYSAVYRAVSSSKSAKILTGAWRAAFEYPLGNRRTLAGSMNRPK